MCVKHRRTGGWVFILMAALTWLAAQPAQAIWVNLTPEQADKAVKTGGFAASMGGPRFMEKWVVNLGEGKGAALLMTEFLSLAFASQEAARNMAALEPWEVQDALGRARGKLVFSVTTFGDNPEYADGLRGWVIYKGEKRQNTHWQNGKPEPTEDGRYVTDSTFWFTMDGIDPNGQLTLLIEHVDGRQKWEFPFDLSTMR